jgi:type IV secretory pathway VirB4 component
MKKSSTKNQIEGQLSDLIIPVVKKPVKARVKAKKIVRENMVESNMKIRPKPAVKLSKIESSSLVDLNKPNTKTKFSFKDIFKFPKIRLPKFPSKNIIETKVQVQEFPASILTSNITMPTNPSTTKLPTYPKKSSKPFKLSKLSLKRRNINPEVLDFEANYPVEQLYAQNGMTIESDYIKHSNKFSKSYYLTSLPKFLTIEGVSSLFKLNEKSLFPNSFDFTIKISVAVKASNLLLDQQFKTVKSNIEMDSTIPIFGSSTVKAGNEIADLEQIEDKLAKGQELTDTCLVLTIFADSHSELMDIDKHIQTRFRLRKWVFASPIAEQREVFLNSMPIPIKATDTLKLLTEPLSMLLLPTSSRPHGMLPIGYDKYRGNVYLWDLFREGRAHTCSITGKNGSGKSAYCKSIFEMLGILGVQRFYIDPEGECSLLAAAIGAKVEHINQSKGINIVDFNEHIVDYFDEEDKAKFNPQADHINWMTEVLLRFPVFPTEVHGNRSMLYKAFNDFYKSDTGKIKANRNMRHLCEFLKAEDQKYGLWQYMFNFSAEGTMGNIFSSEDDFYLDEDAIIFDTSGNENPEIRKILGYVLLYKTFEKMLTKDRYRCLVIDELHMFIEFEGFRNLLIQYIKRARKYNGFYMLITQELNDFKKYQALSILQQTGFDFIFRQSSIDSETLTLSPTQAAEITEMPVGTCVIHQMDKPYLDKVKIHLRDYQLAYSAKANNQNLSFDTYRRFRVEKKRLGG